MPDPSPKAPRYKPGHAVKYQGKLWKVSQVVSGPLGAAYLLHPTTPEGAATVEEGELEEWKNG
jgi:hypothetical protein